MPTKKKKAPEPEPEMAEVIELRDERLDYCESLLAMEPEVRKRAVEETSDLRRTHLMNIAGCLSGLRSALGQEVAWTRP